MSAPRGHRAEAIVVRTVDFAETSQIVHLVTAAGLVSALAKGARAPKGAFQGGLTLGVMGEADLLPRRGAEHGRAWPRRHREHEFLCLPW